MKRAFDQVTEEMVRRGHERGLEPSLQTRVLERSYYFYLNGESTDTERNYFKALSIELSQSRPLEFQT